MDKRDIDRWIIDEFRAMESRVKCLFDSTEPVDEVSISLATMRQLRAVSEAVGVRITVRAQDSSSNPLSREVLYNGARFWCRVQEVEW